MHAKNAINIANPTSTFCLDATLTFPPGVLGEFGELDEPGLFDEPSGEVDVLGL